MIDEYDVLMVFRRLALVGRNDDPSVSIPKTAMSNLLKMAMADRFDEKWYLENYNDVAEAVRKGAIASGLDHYSAAGVYEGRIPYPFAIDELDYLNRHRDVARSLDKGPYKTAAEHFYAVGFLENRTFQMAETEVAEEVEVEAATQ